MTTTTASRFPLSLPRTLGLARWNAVLLLRNRLAITYAIVIPIIPLALLFTGDRGDGAVGSLDMPSPTWPLPRSGCASPATCTTSPGATSP